MPSYGLRRRSKPRAGNPLGVLALTAEGPAFTPTTASGRKVAANSQVHLTGTTGKAEIIHTLFQG